MVSESKPFRGMNAQVVAAAAGALAVLLMAGSAVGDLQHDIIHHRSPLPWAPHNPIREGEVITLRQTASDTPIAQLPYIRTGMEDPFNFGSEELEVLTLEFSYVGHLSPMRWTLHGPLVYRHLTGGAIASIVHYVDGEPVEDVQEVRFSNGELAGIGPALRYPPTGAAPTMARSPMDVRIYYRDGSPSYEATFVKFPGWVYEGREKTYFTPCGYPFYPGPGMNGLWIESCYRAGTRIWMKVYYPYPDGGVRQERYYRRGAEGSEEPCGLWMYYAEDGSLSYSEDYGPCPPDPFDPEVDADPDHVIIRGHVTDEEGNPVPDATVTIEGDGSLAGLQHGLKGGAVGATVNSSGHYQIAPRDFAYLEILISAPGKLGFRDRVQTKGRKVIICDAILQDGLFPSGPVVTYACTMPRERRHWAYMRGAGASRFNAMNFEARVDWKNGDPKAVIMIVNSNASVILAMMTPPSDEYMERWLYGPLDPDNTVFHDERLVSGRNTVSIYAENAESEISAVPFILRPALVSAPAWSSGGGRFGILDDNRFAYQKTFSCPGGPLVVGMDPATCQDEVVRNGWNALPYIGGVAMSAAMDVTVHALLGMNGAGKATATGALTHTHMGATGAPSILKEGRNLALAPVFGSRHDWLWKPITLRAQQSRSTSPAPVCASSALFPELLDPGEQNDASFGRLIRRLANATVEADVKSRIDLQVEIREPAAGGGLELHGDDSSMVMEILGEKTTAVGASPYRVRRRIFGGGTLRPAPKDSAMSIVADLWLSNDCGSHWQKHFSNSWVWARPGPHGKRASEGGPQQQTMREFSCVPAALGAAGAPAFLGEELAVAGPSRAVPELQQWRLVANAQAGGSPAVASDFESGGHGLMVVHVSRDPDDSADRDTEISYAYSSELGGSVAGGSFEEHGRIANNKRAEGAPTVAFDTAGRAVCAWVQVKSENTVSSDPSTVPPQMEIVWSRYDPDSDAWSAPAALTADAYLDYSPRLLRGPTGGLLVYWLRNKKNSPIADATAPLQVRYAVWNPAAAAFGAVATLPGDIASCAGLSLAWNETRFVAAYAQDLDGNLADGTDCEIFTMVHDGTGWSSPQRVTTNSVADRNPRVLFAIPQGDTAEYHLVWLQDGKIVQRHPVTGAVAVLREADRDPEFFDFELLGNRWGEIGVFWRDEGDGQPDIFYRLLGLQMVAYVPGSELIDYRTRWSGEMRLVDDASSEDQLAGAWADNTIDLAFVTTDPGSGQVDLRYAAKRFFWPDLVIGPDDVWITPADAAPGQAVTVHARVRNLGDGEAPKLSFYPNLHVAFYQGDPAAGGTLIESVLVYTWPDQALVGGSSVEVSVPWSLPVSVPSIDQARVYVLADPFDGPGLTDGIDELSDANNTGSFQFRPVDLEATMLRVDELGGGSVSIVGTISNKGAVPVAGAEVSCQLDGVEQGTRVVPALGEDEGADVVFYMPAGYSGRPTCLVTLTVDPANRFEETDEGNNVQNYGASTDQTPLPAGGTDSDGDGMADAWEATHLGDLSRDGTGDLDGDGMSDGEEHSAGTDPADGASALVVSGLGLADGGISLSWQGAKGKTYQVEFCPDLLTGSWTRLDSGCYAGEDGTIVVQDVPTSPSGFYRVTIDDSFEPPLQSPR